MTIKSKKKNNVFSQRILLFILVIILLGCCLRFYNLDRKIYWGDETVTSLRISGYSIEELQERAFNGDEFTIEELKKYQYPNENKSLVDTIQGLAREEPQHPPLYFILAKLWVKVFGNSITATRSFSAVISLLIFPCLYWLCLELFSLANTKWVAISLVAVSPFHIIYAQEARSYSLWTVTILLSSACLLRAIRKKTNLSWTIYTITLIVSYYTFLFSGMLTIIHGTYLIIIEKFKFDKNTKYYIWSLLSGLLAFFPWIFAVYTNAMEADQTTSWTKKKVLGSLLVKSWILNLSRIFVDFNYNFINRNIFFYCVFLVILLVIFYSLINLICHTRQETWLFILLLITIPSLSLVLLDLSSGGIRSTVARYFIPSYIGIELAVSYTFAHNILLVPIKNWQRQMWSLILVLIISSGLISGFIYSESEVWWNKYNGIHLLKVAKIINQFPESKVITSWHYLMIFSHILKPQVKLQTLTDKIIIDIQNQNTNICHKSIIKNLKLEENLFVHNTSNSRDALIDLGYELEAEYKWRDKIEPVYETKTQLWKLTKRL